MSSPSRIALLGAACLALLCINDRIGAADASARVLKAEALGEKEYMSHCASCHGESMRGGFGPPLTGAAFRIKWGKQDPKFLTTLIAKTMPPAAPDSLSRLVYSRIAGYLRAANALDADAAVSQVPGAADEGANVPPGRDVPTTSANEDAIESGGVGAVVPNEDAIYHQVLANRAEKLASLAPVSEAELRNPSPEDWLQWRRTDDGQGFSPLKQINRDNVAQLRLAWALALPHGTNEIVPIVRDGVLFVNSAETVLALDARDGDTLWKYSHAGKVVEIGPPVSQPRGMAIYGKSLLVPTLDNHMIALDIGSGEVIWKRAFEGAAGSLRTTAAPIVVRGKIIQGTAGCGRAVLPHGCFIAALDANSGEEIWRLYTIPKTDDQPGGKTWNGAPPDKRTGASIWTTGTYDLDTDLVYIGTGQTYHIASLMRPGGERSTANSGLYTDATLALDPDTGAIVWHYQHLERDVWDLDWSFERVLFDMDYKGRRRRVVATMGKLGILDVLDARTGEYLLSYDLGMQDLVTKIDPVTGRKTTAPDKDPVPGRPMEICPFAAGARNWPATSYDPTRGLLYVPLGYSCMELLWDKGEEWDIVYSARPQTDANGNNGRFAAIDVARGKLRWDTRYRAAQITAALATAGGIVFEGGRDRMFRALDSNTGEALWEVRLDNMASSFPVSFAYDGTQYVAVTTGAGNPNDVTRASQTPELDRNNQGTTLWVFKLPPQ